jgi:Holliday junction resolvase-like predicted endonuclease
MTSSTRYLEAAKAEELAAELEAAGYNVTRAALADESGYDLVAAKDNQRIAIEVKARSALRESADAIHRLREQARQQGYSEFRLVVVNPPHEKTIQIEGLESVLLPRIMDNIARRYGLHPTLTYSRGASDIRIDSLVVTAEGIRVAGTGAVAVQLGWKGPEADESIGWQADVPFSFDVLLDHALQLKEVYQIEADTSSLDE